MTMWLYFGCGPCDIGHYVHTENGSKLHRYGRPGPDYQKLTLDGMLTPQPESAAILYQAALSRLGGWQMSALSWWDRSADKRGASNSTIFAPHMNIEPAVMLEVARERFPWVFSRTPVPVTLWTPTTKDHTHG